MRILVTGGAGFVGAHLALAFKLRYPTARVVSLDNLKRRGSELNLPRLREGGVEFVHGDIRNLSDLESVGAVDVIVECSAEPSVHAGYGESPAYLVQTNLIGTINALEIARRHKATFLFLSTSRVYPIADIRNLPFEQVGTRLDVPQGVSGLGWSRDGVSEEYPLNGIRSLYGATKLASELLIEEYAEMYNFKAVINRCGVLTGPWQMGKVDQGFVVLWAARHFWSGKLAYMGFGGHGHQVRDMLHVEDLFDLLVRQLESGTKQLVYNVGGGFDGSLSLRQASDICAELAGRELDIGAVAETRPADIPWFITDSRVARKEFNWEPKRGPRIIFKEIFEWISANADSLKPILHG
jgi:CDP-paratose 2-epimerase